MILVIDSLEQDQKNMKKMFDHSKNVQKTSENRAKMNKNRICFFLLKPRIWGTPPFKPNFHAISKMVQHL